MRTNIRLLEVGLAQYSIGISIITANVLSTSSSTPTLLILQWRWEVWMWYLTFQTVEMLGNAKNVDQAFYKQIKKENRSCEEAIYCGD